MNLPKPDRATLLAALSRHLLLGRLGDAAQAALAEQFQCESLPADALVADGDGLSGRLGWLMAGEASLQRSAPDALVPLQAGDLFGCGGLPQCDPQHWRVRADGAVQIAWLEADALMQAGTSIRCWPRCCRPHRPTLRTTLRPTAHASASNRRTAC